MHRRVSDLERVVVVRKWIGKGVLATMIYVDQPMSDLTF